MNYHILTMAEDLKTINVVFHIPVPAAGTNQAGISWQNAVVLELGGSANIISVLPGITAAEDTAMKAGQIVEMQRSIRFSKIGLTNAQRKAEIEAAFTALKSELIAEKQVTLNWIGFSADVP